jgi:hypothetical protein
MEENKKMLTQEVREALKAELEYLQSQRSKLDAKIQALKSVLSPTDELELFQPGLPLQSPQRTISANNNGSLQGKGLSESIVEALKRFPAGLTLDDLATEMERLGFRTSGKTKLRTLLISESWRLHNKRHILDKRGKKYFVPAKEQSEVGGGTQQ